jgi:phosphate transport system substrate-binding protein
LYTTKPHLLGDALVAFAQSPEGQALVSKAGFVDLTPRSDPTPVTECKGCTAEYKKATAGASRMSVDFRFESGGTNLDSRGLRDIDRVTTAAKSEHAKKVLLLGFADSQGAPTINLSISTDRAKAVQKLVKDKSLDADAIGFGDSMPVASNATPEGRERNRRVEVWLAK